VPRPATLCRLTRKSRTRSYRHWLESTKPFPNVTAELAALARHGDYFRRIIAPDEGDIIFRLCSFLDAYDIRTAYPLLLAIMDAGPADAEWDEISTTLESYLLRRAVCNLGTKNYNRIFLALTRNLRKDGFNVATLKGLLLAQTGDSGAWPDNATFREAWLHKPLYGPLNSSKLVHLYARLNQTFMSSKSEAVTFSEQPTVEHIMPQSWEANWPLPDGSKGMDFMELLRASESDPRAAANGSVRIMLPVRQIRRTPLFLQILLVTIFRLSVRRPMERWPRSFPKAA
jgi:hypothetical protein